MDDTEEVDDLTKDGVDFSEGTDDGTSEEEERDDKS